MKKFLSIFLLSSIIFGSFQSVFADQTNFNNYQQTIFNRAISKLEPVVRKKGESYRLKVVKALRKLENSVKRDDQKQVVQAIVDYFSPQPKEEENTVAMDSTTGMNENADCSFDIYSGREVVYKIKIDGIYFKSCLDFGNPDKILQFGIGTKNISVLNSYFSPNVEDSRKISLMKALLGSPLFQKLNETDSKLVLDIYGITQSYIKGITEKDYANSYGEYPYYTNPIYSAKTAKDLKILIDGGLLITNEVKKGLGGNVANYRQSGYTDGWLTSDIVNQLARVADSSVVVATTQTEQSQISQSSTDASNNTTTSNGTATERFNACDIGSFEKTDEIDLSSIFGYGMMNFLSCDNYFGKDSNAFDIAFSKLVKKAGPYEISWLKGAVFQYFGSQDSVKSNRLAQLATQNSLFKSTNISDLKDTLKNGNINAFEYLANTIGVDTSSITLKDTIQSYGYGPNLASIKLLVEKYNHNKSSELTELLKQSTSSPSSDLFTYLIDKGADVKVLTENGDGKTYYCYGNFTYTRDFVIGKQKGKISVGGISGIIEQNFGIPLDINLLLSNSNSSFDADLMAKTISSAFEKLHKNYQNIPSEKNEIVSNIERLFNTLSATVKNTGNIKSEYMTILLKKTPTFGSMDGEVEVTNRANSLKATIVQFYKR